MSITKEIFIALIVLTAHVVKAEDYVAVDSLNVTTESAEDSVRSQHSNIIGKIINYFNHTNDVRPEKKFDISVIGGPSYSEATSVELAALISGLYKTSSDSLTPRSEVAIYGEGSVTGMYNFGVRGNHIFPKDKVRLVYDANFCHFPLKFWGIGYEMAQDKSNESKYTLLESDLDIRAMWRLPHNIYIGPSVNFNYQKATKMRRPELWDGYDTRIFCYGFGLAFELDTRDLPNNAFSGYCLSLRQQFFPKFMGNSYAFSMTDLSACFYKRFWSSGVVAFRVHGASAYGRVPWGMLPTLDQGHAIRGYYEGRYRDKNEADMVVELRQHVWRRNGIVVWGGVGTVFRHFSDVMWSRLLPTCGIGYRWEFKNRVNVRVDFGIGKHSTAISFGINESF